MKTLKTLSTALLLAGMLAGCGHTGAPTATAQTAASIQAQKAKGEGKRPAPPASGVSAKPTQGLAARESARIADHSLIRYSDLLRDWERAYTDYEKDRIEQSMVSELHFGLEEVQRETSATGHDEADRRAYDIADAGLNRYDRLYRDWTAAWGDREKRRILNDMMSGMVSTLQDIKRNY